MNEQRLESGDAARELEEIQRRRAGVVDAVLVPRWYWWMVGLLLVPLGAAADSHHRLVTAVVAVVVALVIAAVSVWMITGVYRGARIHPATLGAAGSLYIVGFISVVVGVSLVFAFSWQAAGYAYPGTLGTIIAAAMLIVGGPILMSRIRRAMVQGSPVGHQ
jgi:uncharacterized membrane protein